jgi:uridine kinase
MAENIEQRIIAIIGPRKAGKTIVAEKIQHFRPEYQRAHMWIYAVQEFCNLHNMTVTEFFMRPEHGADIDLNRILFSLYCDYKRKQDINFSLTPILDYIKRRPKFVIDDIYYFNELESLLKLNTTVIYVDTDRDVRVKRGLTRKMEELEMCQDVASIQAKDVKNWRETYILNNDKDMHTLHMKIQTLVEELRL